MSAERIRTPKLIEVGMDKWVVRRDSCVIETTGLGPCIGIIIHDPVLKIAAVSHFIAPEFGDSELSAMLRKVRKSFTNLEEAKVYLGGGCLSLDQPDYSKKHISSGSCVEEALKDMGITDSQLSRRWNLDSFEGMVMRVNLVTGDVTYEDIDDSNL